MRGVVVLVLAVVGLVAASCSGTATPDRATGTSPGVGSTATGASTPSTPASDATGTGTTLRAGRAPVPSAGCRSGAVEAVDTEKHTLAVADQERFYFLSAPAGDAATPRPLVLDFHGLGEGAQVQAALSQLGTLGRQEGFVTATPNGTGTPVRWNTTDPSDANPDLQFVDALVAEIEASSCIDTARVYATGISYGAIMTSFLACNRSQTFAAFAPVAGIYVPNPCNETGGEPMLAFHGTADPVLFFNGGVNPRVMGVLGAPAAGAGGESTTTTLPPPDLEGKGYPENVRKWAARDGCDPTPTDTRDSDEVIHRVYSCPAGEAVELFIVVGGGHTWPGATLGAARAGRLGPTTKDVDATKEMWAFFQRFALPA